MENKNKKYSIYIDESGIISKIGHSVYVLVYIKYVDEPGISDDILKIEKDLNISHIHWVNMSNTVRLKLARKLRNIDFTCKYVLYDNPIIQQTALENVLTNLLKSEDSIVSIMIDGKSSKKYENSLK